MINTTSQVTFPIRAGSPLRFAVYQRLTGIMLGTMVCVVIAAAVLWQSNTQARNPLDEYADIFPGHNWHTAELHGFGCQQATNNYSYYSSGYATCTLSPSSGAFSQIEVLVDRDVIVQSTFRIRDNGLRFGDLMLSMDMQNLYTYPNELVFFWNTLFINVKTSVRKNAIALRPIDNITITDVGFQWPSPTFTGQANH